MVDAERTASSIGSPLHPTHNTAARRNDVRIVVLACGRLYRDGLVLVLSSQPGLSIVGQGPSDREGIRLTATLSPDVVLVDAPAACATSIVEDLARLSPCTRVVAYGVAEEDHEAIQCAEAGVAGYVPQSATTDDLVATALSVVRGEFACSPRVAALLLRRVSALAASGRVPAQPVLTPRETQIVQLIDDGLSNKEIAARLGIEVSTVKNHVHHLLEKLNARRRIQAAAHVRRARI